MLSRFMFYTKDRLPYPSQELASSAEFVIIKQILQDVFDWVTAAVGRFFVPFPQYLDFYNLAQ